MSIAHDAFEHFANKTIADQVTAGSPTPALLAIALGKLLRIDPFKHTHRQLTQRYAEIDVEGKKSDRFIQMGASTTKKAKKPEELWAIGLLRAMRLMPPRNPSTQVVMLLPQYSALWDQFTTRELLLFVRADPRARAERRPRRKHDLVTLLSYAGALSLLPPQEFAQRTAKVIQEMSSAKQGEYARAQCGNGPDRVRREFGIGYDDTRLRGGLRAGRRVGLLFALDVRRRAHLTDLGRQYCTTVSGRDRYGARCRGRGGAEF